MKLILILLYSLIVHYSFCQEINWAKTSDWKIYEIHDGNAFRYSMDTLSNFKSIPLNDDSIRQMLKNCSIWPKEKTSVWMGLYVATYSDEKKNIRKIDISVYGGFFWDENSKSYYEVEDLLKSNWADFWHDSASKFDR